MADFVRPRMPSFFQVILEDNLLQGKLNIPQNFARKYGDGILSSVKLEDPTGKVLNVGLTRREGSISFQSGWNEFAKHYSLKLGQFLVFRREGNGKFRVLIFELSASEIDYLNRSSRNGKGSTFDRKLKDPKLEEEVAVFDGEILHGIPRYQEATQISPCFFQIILEDCLREGKLRIPKKFAREHGDGISRQVKLEDPTGAVWKVGLTKKAGSMWFRNGWKKFVKHYSIKIEYFLVFMLEGRNKFRVLIFDPSATEIDYPSRGSKSAIDCSLDEQSQEPEDDIDVDGAVDDLPFDEAEQVPQMKREVDPIQGKDNAEATFKSNNPCVIVSLQPSDVGKESGRLYLPNKFLEKHFTNFAGNVTLHSMDGRTWPAKYICNSIYAGWEAFVRGNGLVAGDDCLFQLIMNAEENSLKITINPNPEKPNCCSSPPPHSRPSEPIGATGGSTKEKPIRVVLLQYMIKQLCVASLFRNNRKFMEQNRTDWELRVGDRTWPLTIGYSKNKLRLLSGWHPFARENRLQAGDALRFEIDDKRAATIKVSVERGR